MSQTGATLFGSYSVKTSTVTETGFEYGLTESALTTTLPCSGTSRNYKYCYDNSHYAALWVAYPLTYAYTQGSASNSDWKYDPNLKDAVQPTHPRNPTRESAVARLSRKPRIFSTNYCKTQIIKRDNFLISYPGRKSNVYYA